MRSHQPFDGRVPPPDFVNIETTKYCNLSCPMCHQFQDGTTVAGPHLELDRFRRWADVTLPFATRFQPSVTGEPLMSKGFPAMLEKAREYGVRLDLVSNATLLNARMRQMLLPVLGRILISFDGATRHTFEAIRAGADFDVVCRNVQALCAERDELPPDERPIIELGCVLQRSNVGELPDLVGLAGELGVDALLVSHIHPPTDELKRESLVHEQELAIECIEQALRRADELGLPMVVNALDQLIAASALAVSGRRELPSVDGVVAGLEERSVHVERMRPWPRALPAGADEAEIAGRRQRAWDGQDLERPAAGRVREDLPESIWFCDFLWNKTYVTLPGDIRTCCVPGTPVIGNLEQQRFDEVWNDWLYRAMRVRIALRDPVPVCRGCQHIREIRDPVEIDRLLQGQALPEIAGWRDLPAILDPTKLSRLTLPKQQAGLTPPVLHWDAANNARGYEVELSIDRFVTLAFSTAWHGPLVEENRYAIPDWAWAQAPVGVPVYWRVVAWLPDKKLEVALGVVERQPPGEARDV